MRADRDAFGITARGEAVDRFTIANDGSLQLQAITFGGIITSLLVADRNGATADVVLGLDTLEAYEQQTAYLGAIIGRSANRIANARFTLDGAAYQLEANDAPHHLHGGASGFDRKVWEATSFVEIERAGVRFSRVSASGEAGYPGELTASVTYTVHRQPRLTIDYEATTTAPTLVNLTQHSYFDLSAGAAPDVLDHVLTIRARAYTPVDAGLIPSGVIAAVAATPFDFTAPRAIGARIDEQHEQLAYGGGYDHNWVLDDGGIGDTAAMVFDPISGRTLTIETTEPGLQFYSGNRLDIPHGRGRRAYARRTGFCLETQHFPDSPSHAHFPPTVLRPGHRLRSRTTWTFGTH